MFRNLQDINSKPINAMFKAGADMVMGQGVVKNLTTGEVEYVSTAKAEDVFFVTKDAQPTGEQTIHADVSEYELQNIAQGEGVLLVKGVVGERYWTDQVAIVSGAVSGITVGNRVVADTNGKFIAATTEKSNLLVTSITTADAGVHAGIVIEIADWA